MNDAAGLRAHSFMITTRAKCAEDGRAIEGAFLLTIKRVDGERFRFVVATTDRLIELINDLAPEFVDLDEAAGEHCPLPHLLGDGTALLH